MDVEVISDGKTVWINSAACCIGRFSRFGIDIHHDYIVQMSGAGQCLDCKPGPVDVVDWNHFKFGTLNHYGVIIGDEHMPNYLKGGKQ